MSPRGLKKSLHAEQELAAAQAAAAASASPRLSVVKAAASLSFIVTRLSGRTRVSAPTGGDLSPRTSGGGGSEAEDGYGASPAVKWLRPEERPKQQDGAASPRKQHPRAGRRSSVTFSDEGGGGQLEAPGPVTESTVAPLKPPRAPAALRGGTSSEQDLPSSSGADTASDDGTLEGWDAELGSSSPLQLPRGSAAQRASHAARRRQQQLQPARKAAASLAVRRSPPAAAAPGAAAEMNGAAAAARKPAFVRATSLAPLAPAVKVLLARTRRLSRAKAAAVGGPRPLAAPPRISIGHVASVLAHRRMSRGGKGALQATTQQAQEASAYEAARGGPSLLASPRSSASSGEKLGIFAGRDLEKQLRKRKSMTVARRSTASLSPSRASAMGGEDEDEEAEAVQRLASSALAFAYLAVSGVRDAREVNDRMVATARYMHGFRSLGFGSFP